MSHFKITHLLDNDNFGSNAGKRATLDRPQLPWQKLNNGRMTGAMPGKGLRLGQMPNDNK